MINSKKLKLWGVSAASSLALAASMAMPLSTFALTSDTSVVNSGDDAEINSTVTQTQTIGITNANTATTNQTMSASSNTGQNEMEGNIGGGSITTGAALATGAMAVEANSNLVGISLPSWYGLTGQTTEVVNTGDDAEVNSTWNQLKALTVANTNVANTYQTFAGTSNTGHNEAEDNIGGVGIQTGAATSTGTMGVAVNENKTTVVGGGLAGLVNPLLGSAASLTNTGDDVELNNLWSSTGLLTVVNSNTAANTQTMSASANSGHNEAEENIGGVGIQAGAAAATGQQHIATNSNQTGIGGWGNPILGTVIDLVNTGDDLEANNTLTDVFTLTSLSTNALVQNQTSAFTSNTGHNESEDNIGGSGLVSTGAGAGGTQHANSNTNTTVFGSVADVLLFLALGS